MGNADSVMSFLQVIRSCLAAVEKKAGLSRWDSLIPGPSRAVHYVPSTSTAHQALTMDTFGSLNAPSSPADATM